jgi:thiamine-phosphate pyrophosphorylase
VSAIPAPLLVVTDRHQARAPLVETVGAICAAGGRWIWFRDRDLDLGERRRLAESLSGIVRSSGAFLTVGGDVELAASVAADGVHLPSEASVSAARQLLGARALIGVSAHGLDDVRRATEAGADYVTLSPIFPSSSKPGYGPALGVSAIGIAVRCGVPIVALGGITPSRAGECRLMGAAGVAVMGDMMCADNPDRLVADYQETLAESERRSSLPAR